MAGSKNNPNGRDQKAAQLERGKAIAQAISDASKAGYTVSNTPKGFMVYPQGQPEKAIRLAKGDAGTPTSYLDAFISKQQSA